jgi:hypothetical protein
MLDLAFILEFPQLGERIQNCLIAVTSNLAFITRRQSIFNFLVSEGGYMIPRLSW